MSPQAVKFFLQGLVRQTFENQHNFKLGKKSLQALLTSAAAHSDQNCQPVEIYFQIPVRTLQWLGIGRHAQGNGLNFIG